MDTARDLSHQVGRPEVDMLYLSRTAKIRPITSKLKRELLKREKTSPTHERSMGAHI